MPLTPGTRLGPYEIIAALGAGGMGEVYRAKDTRLDRTVAIKVLPAQLSADPQFRERFDREAKSISALSHPNICALYDVGRDHEIDFLVLEYLEGETLAARLAKGALPMAEALRIATDVASALESAHRHGIIHRDLKPGNVMLMKSGAPRSGAPQAKLLDFGLAKIGSIGPLSGVAHTAMPTASAPLTAQGTILGTYQYMAPEQIEGEEADARTDIFAFGAVLYEMLTGRRAFQGKSQASLIGAILKEEPPPVSEVQPVAPAALDHLVRTCLAKDPDARFQTAHDVGLQLRWIAEGGSAAGLPVPVAARRRSRERLAWTAATILGAIAMATGLVAVVHMRETPPKVDPVAFAIGLPENSVFSSPAQFALSSDGQQLVFVASTRGVSTLWVRALGSLTARALPGTEGAGLPFWSPDGRHIGFFSFGKLKRVDLSGGSPADVCVCVAVQGLGGGTWNGDNVMVFAPSQTDPLQKVDAAGGTPTPLTTLDKGETSHRFPSFLPDGRHVLYLAVREGARELRVASLGSTDTTQIGAAESNGLYASGHLLFSRGGSLMAQPFDQATLRVNGDPFPIANDVPVANTGRSAFSVSASGVLSYLRGDSLPMSRLTWMDRGGKTIGVVGEAGAYHNLSLSPDERRIAVSRTAGSPQNRDIWLIDLARADTASRLTSDPAIEADPIWSPDGSQVLYNSNRDGGRYNSGFRRASDFGAQEIQVIKTGTTFSSPEWSHDGRFLAYQSSGPQTALDLWVLPFTADGQKTVLLQTPFSEDDPAFSPDDRWVAYNSNRSGRLEVYVKAFSSGTSGGGELPISRDSGWGPRWGRDGKELFFLALDGTMMVADITIGKELQASVPRPLFPTPLLRSSDRHTYAVTKDGTRFLLAVPERGGSTPITVVVNWLTAVKP